MDLIKQRLDALLQEVKQQFKDRRIGFSHAKYRFEIEVPSDLVDKHKPAHFEFTSQRQGFQRFHTREVKALVDELEHAEETLKDALTPFLCALFQRFHEHKELWNQAVSMLTELDCLASLAIVSGQQVGEMCRPNFIEYEG